ncbi:MAG: hypothetical protein KGZ68_11115 [Dechloromonas sp.]|jgi:hypothetical protein|nr:hypothetical protein [Dechloromonas sp.]
MRELIEDLMTNPSQKRLVVMPLTRLLFYEPFAIDGFHFFPSEAIDLATLRPVPNKTLECAGAEANVIRLEGQDLREVSTSLTGFNVEILSNSPLVAFNVDIDWNEFLEANHDYDISLLKLLSSKAERALDIIRLFYCRLDLPNTLPGQIGSWEGSGEYLGALLYSPEDHESYLIAGAAVESSAIVRGLGLELDAAPQLALPSANDGEVAGVVLHGLSLYSEALNSSNETIKFSRVMTLFEFLASPDEYQNWKKLKGDIACHCASDKANYLRLCERFRALTSIENTSGKQAGLRTLIVHNGKLLPELLPSFKERAALFRELQGYAFTVLTDMLSNAGASWVEYVEYRDQLKRALGVA